MTAVQLAPHDLSGRELARRLGVAPSTFSRLLRGASGVTPEMALRLSQALGRSPESWLALQANHDLRQAKRHTRPDGVSNVTSPAV